MFYDNLKAECERQGLKLTPTVLECGGTKGVIGGWKTGAIPRSDIVMKLSVRLNVPTDYLLFGEKKKISMPDKDTDELIRLYSQLSEIDRSRVLERTKTLAELADERAAAAKTEPETPKSHTRTVEINLYDMPSSAGTGAFLDHTRYEKIQISCTPEALRADFAIPIIGDSMEPDFHSDDIVLVKSCPYVNVGEIGIFVLDGDAYIKEYGGDCLISLNEKYKPIMLKSYETAVCLGRVLGIAEVV